MFGDVKRLIHTDLVREGYIDITRDTNSDPPRVSISWGPRAGIETCKKDILDFVCSFTDSAPTDWPVQFREAAEEKASACQSGNVNGAEEDEEM